MFFAVLRMECDKVFKRKLPWVGMALTLLTFLLFFFMVFDVMHLQGQSRLFPWPAGIVSGTFIIVSSLPIASIGILLCVIIAAGSTAQEYGWHSLQLWLCQGVSRSTLFFAKVLVCCLTILFITLVALIAGVLTSLFASLQLHQSIDFGRLHLLQFFLAWLRLSYSILPYTLFAFMLAILFRSITPAVSLGIGVAGIGEMLMLPIAAISPLARQIWSWMPQALANSLNQLNFAAAGYADPPRGFYGTIPVIYPGLAVLGIALYSLLFVGIAYSVFLRQNMNG